jgi:hypothetical protein
MWRIPSSGIELSQATAGKVLVTLKSLLKEARYGHLADGVVIKKNGNASA